MKGFVWGKQVLPLSYAGMVFHTNPCNFRNFLTVAKYFLKALPSSNLLLIYLFIYLWQAI